MKKLLITLVMLSLAISLAAQQTWTPISPEQAARKAIMMHINKINHYFFSYGGGMSSSAREAAIFDFLKGIGTPLSLDILKSLIGPGGLPEHLLDLI